MVNCASIKLMNITAYCLCMELFWVFPVAFVESGWCGLLGFLYHPLWFPWSWVTSCMLEQEEPKKSSTLKTPTMAIRFDFLMAFLRLYPLLRMPGGLCFSPQKISQPPSLKTLCEPHAPGGGLNANTDLLLYYLWAQISACPYQKNKLIIKLFYYICCPITNK